MSGALTAHLKAFRSLRPHVVHVNRNVPWSAATVILAALSTPGARVVTVDQLPLRTVEAVKLWRKMGEKARAAAIQKHTAERMAAAYLDLWKEVVAGPPVPRLRVRGLEA